MDINNKSVRFKYKLTIIKYKLEIFKDIDRKSLG